MTPEDVPAEVVDEFCRKFWGAPAAALTDSAQRIARDTLAAALPAYREQLTRQAASLIVHGPAGFGIHCQACGRTQLAASGEDMDASFVLAVILGHAASPEHAAHGGQS